MDKARADSFGAQLLSTIPGVGPILSATILAEIGDINRFHSAGHSPSYAGLCPLHKTVRQLGPGTAT